MSEMHVPKTKAELQVTKVFISLELQAIVMVLLYSFICSDSFPVRFWVNLFCSYNLVYRHSCVQISLFISC